MSAPTSSFRPPRQARSRKALEAVLQAGRELLEEGGIDAFQISAVAARAGVSVGTIYNRFDSKDALLYEVHRRVLREILAEHTAVFEAERWDGMSTTEVVAEAVQAVAEIMHAHASLLRVFMQQGSADRHIGQIGSENSRVTAEQFKRVLLRRAADFRAPQPPELAADLCFRMVYDVIARRVMWGPTFESQLALSWEETIAGLISACTAYLLYEAPPPDVSG